MSESSYVYFAPHKSEYRFKIGKSINPLERLQMVAFKNDHDIDLMRTFAVKVESESESFQIEHLFHLALRKHKCPTDMCGDDGKTEWFSMSGYESALQIARSIGPQASFILIESWGKDVLRSITLSESDNLRQLLIESLERWRLSLNLTQSQVAERMGVPYPTFRHFIKSSWKKNRASEIRMLQILGLSKPILDLIAEQNATLGLHSTKRRARQRSK